MRDQLICVADLSEITGEAGASHSSWTVHVLPDKGKNCWEQSPNIVSEIEFTEGFSFL